MNLPWVKTKHRWEVTTCRFLRPIGGGVMMGSPGPGAGAGGFGSGAGPGPGAGAGPGFSGGGVMIGSPGPGGAGGSGVVTSPGKVGGCVGNGGGHICWVCTAPSNGSGQFSHTKHDSWARPLENYTQSISHSH